LRGGKSKRTPALRKQLLELLELGMLDKDVCAYAHISPAFFYDWIKRDADLEAAVLAARQKGKVQCLRVVQALADPDGVKALPHQEQKIRLSAATWVLTHMHPGQFAERRIISTDNNRDCPLDRFFPTANAAGEDAPKDLLDDDDETEAPEVEPATDA